MELKKNLAAFLVHDFEMENLKRTVDSSSQSHQDQHPISEDRIIRQSSTSANNERVLQDYNKIVEMEAVIVEDLVKPLTFMFKYFIPFHDTISFDPVSRCCILVKGSFLRRVVCIFWQLLVIYRLVIKAIPGLTKEAEPEPEKGSLSVLAKGAYFTFILFSCVSFCVYWLKTDKICVIFNHVISLAENFHLHHRSPSRIKAVKVTVHASYVFTFSYVIITVILYTIQIFLPATRQEMHAEDAQALLTMKENRSKTSQFQLDFTEIHVSDGFILIQIVTAVASFMNIFSWMIAFLHLGAWAMLFRQLIVIFYWRIRAKEELGHYILIPQEIRTFNKISSIIDEFNGIYGFSCLLGAVVCVSYVSPSIKHAFSGLSHVPPPIGSGLHLMLSYVPMIATTLMIAEINRMAGSFAGIIKNEFGKFTKECGDPAESLCGIAIVHFDLSTSNIGFKGLGFFTVSYQFVSTIVSVIISYSILVVQLFPHDNSDIEV